MADVQLGKVIHYYDKLGVAVVALDKGSLSVGDKIKIVFDENEFTQTVESMQVDHKSVKKAVKGDDFGLKVDQAVKPKAIVYKVG